MIGDEPPLSPAQSFYQRALAADIDEAVDQAVEILPRMSLSYEFVAVPERLTHASRCGCPLRWTQYRVSLQIVQPSGPGA